MRRSALALLSSLLLSSSAFAKDAIKVDLVPKAQSGQGQPELVVRAEVPLKKLVLDVVRSTDKKRIKIESAALGAGRDFRFPLTIASPGTARFQGKLSIEVENGESGEMPIDVAGELLAPLVIELKSEDVDLEGKRLSFTSSRDLAKVEISAMSDTGTPLGTTETKLEGKDANDRYVAAWKQTKGTVLRISIKAYDPDGFFGGVDLFPWRVDIPHEEVNFRSGSFDIDKSEEPKLESSWKLVQSAIEKYGKLATIKLFVAGHTDTVGDAGSNATLSNNRARAIARWFQKRGAKTPILFAGCGEAALLVNTADETDEPKNRRAEYIVAVDPPGMRGCSPFSSVSL